MTIFTLVRVVNFNAGEEGVDFRFIGMEARGTGRIGTAAGLWEGRVELGTCDVVPALMLAEGAPPTTGGGGRTG